MSRFRVLFVTLLLCMPTLLWAAEDLQDVSMTHEITRLILQLGVIVLAAIAKRMRDDARREAAISASSTE